LYQNRREHILTCEKEIEVAAGLIVANLLFVVALIIEDVTLGSKYEHQVVSTLDHDGFVLSVYYHV
jgi:hypothetical protein